MAFDGRLWFNTKIDNSKIEKELKEVERQIKRSQESISKMEVSKLPLVKQANELGAKLDTAKDKAEQLRKEMESINSATQPGANPVLASEAFSRKAEMETALKASEKEVDKLQKQWDGVNDKLDSYNLKIKQANTDIERANLKASELQSQLATPSQIKMGQAMAKAEKSAKKFNRRLWEIGKSALIFNLVSSGLRKMVSYMGTAMMADKEFANSLAALRGSTMAAFQPIYEIAIPAVTTLVNWLNTAVQVLGRFFAALSGKSYSQMQKNAQALNKQASAIGGVGSAAEEAQRQLMGFDEINRLESHSGGSGGAGGGRSPIFEEMDIPSAWEAIIDSLAMRIKDIFFTWDDLNAEIIAEKLVTALGVIAGGLIGFALGGPGGAVMGMIVGAGIGVAISTILFNGDGKLSGEELLAALTVGLTGITGGLVGFAVGGPLGAAIGMTLGAALGVKLSSLMFNGDGKLSSSEIIRALVAGLSIIAGAVIGFAAGGPAGAALGAVVGLALAFTIQSTMFDGVGKAIQSMLASVRDYFSTTFSNGFIHGLATMVEDGIILLWNLFVEFVNGVVANWNSIWSGISSYHTTGTIGNVGGYNMPAVSSMNVPALARGAVLPANKPFLAMVGDQRNGTNVEAPLETIKQALAEVMAQYGDGDTKITFTGDLAALGRVLAPVVTKAQKNNDRGQGR